MQRSVEDAVRKGFLGQNILGSGITIRIKVIRGAGGYIFGEETTLINSLEGRRGEPRTKPPFPPVEGLLGSPTVVNNIETVINIAPILEMGAKNYRKIGTKNSPGTKLFTVSGVVENQGIFELPLGSTSKEIIKICGGIKKGKRLAFVQIGGIGNFLKGKELEWRLTYDRAKEEVLVGLGNILIVDTDTPIEDLILSWAQFYERESCGQCTPCREGTYQLFKIAERLKRNGLLKKDYENLKDILEVLEKTSLCPLGSFAGENWKEVIRIYGEDFFAKRIRTND